MSFDVRVDDTWPVRLSSSAQVKAAEKQLGIRFPKGYEAFVTTLGEGALKPACLRVYPPERVVHEREPWRQRVDEYWFWDDGSRILEKARALQCVLVADTWAGDEFIVHPDDSDVIFVLPRHSGQVFRITGGLDGLIEWLRAAGLLVAPHNEPCFVASPTAWNAPTLYLLVHEDPVSKVRRDIGVFDTLDAAERAQKYMQQVQGFRRAMEGFAIDRRTLGELAWTRGYHEPDAGTATS